MLFKKTICPQCKTSFDECLENCPICSHRNHGRDPRLIKEGAAWLRWETQLGLAVTGSIGFILLTIIVGMFVSQIGDTTLRLMLGNSIAYLALTCLFIVAIVINRKPLLRFLKDYKSAIWGIAFGAALVGLSIGLEYFLGLFHTPEPGGNQSIIIQMVKAYPVPTFFVICIMGPLCEEITYRLGLFTLLRRFNKPVAYIFTLLIFTAIHLDYTSTNFINELWNMPGYLLGAAILTISYDLKGPYASITCHVINNLVSFISILVIPSA